MSQSVSFFVETDKDAAGVSMNPPTKGSARAMVFGGRAVVFNDNTKNKKWAKKVGLVALSKKPAGAPWTGPVALTLEFFMHKPKSCPKNRIYPTVKPDLDKMIRSVKDALTGILYVDDAQIVNITSIKRYGDMPGVLIEASEGC